LRSSREWQAAGLHGDYQTKAIVRPVIMRTSPRFYPGFPKTSRDNRTANRPRRVSLVRASTLVEAYRDRSNRTVALQQHTSRFAGKPINLETRRARLRAHSYLSSRTLRKSVSDKLAEMREKRYRNVLLLLTRARAERGIGRE